MTVDGMETYRTLWYMGAKTRLVPEFIDGAMADLLEPGGTVLDLCAGTGIVGRYAANRYCVYSNDVQRFSSVVSAGYLVGGEKWAKALDRLDPEADLSHAFETNFEHLQSLTSVSMHREEKLLKKVGEELSDRNPGSATAEYREFVAGTPIPDLELEPGEVDRHYEPLASRFVALIKDRQRDPSVLPYALMTLYYQNVYFGIRQAMCLDSIRAAIDRIPPEDPFQQEKRSLYLTALVQAASVSTSGTSHFAQPRSIQKDSELLAISKRRKIDIEFEFYRSLDSLRREWGERPRHAPNRVFSLPAEDLLAESGPLSPGEVGLVYLDPPYTADNYSRFYHVLETLVDYDYPALERRSGALTRGRYPVREKRFQSDFCRLDSVEDAFRSVIASCHRLGTKLLVSYSPEGGLLLKMWRAQGELQPLQRFLALFRDYYSGVEIRQREIMHSGQGDSNRQVRELLVLCED